MVLAMGLVSASHSIGAAAGAFLAAISSTSLHVTSGVWLSSLALAVGAGFVVFVLQPKQIAAEI